MLSFVWLFLSLLFNEYPQSSKSVNSMFETRSVSTCAEFKPFKRVQTGNALYKYSIYIALRYDVRMSSFHNTGSIQL